MTDLPRQAARMVYLNGLRNAELLYQFDVKAGKAVFYPREVGPSGSAVALQWRRSRGRGVVYASTTVFPRHGAAYNVVLVSVNEGFRMMSTIVTDSPDALAPGTPVQVDFDEIDGVPRAIFRPLP